MALTPRARILLSALAVLVALAALVWWLSKRNRTVPVTPVTLPSSSTVVVAPPNNPTPAPSVGASVTPAPPPAGAEAPPGSLTTPPSAHAAAPPDKNAQPTSTTTPPATPPDLPSSASGLLIPVVGVRPDELRDTFDDARSEGRVHDAIDIMSPCGTPVVAAADGLIVKLFESVRGGTTIYERSTDDKLIYYYAHLKAYAAALAENKTVRRGETIAYVGDTGNAGPGNCHLHFAIWLITDPKHYWDGQNINPYPLLRGR